MHTDRFKIIFILLQDAILGSVSTFKVFLSFHSYYELIIFPWGNRTDPCPDYVRLLEGGTIMARVNTDLPGKVCISEIIENVFLEKYRDHGST